MTATLAASAAILKTKYPNGELPKELYVNNAALAMVPKDTSFDGENQVVAVQTEHTQGASASFSEAITSLAQSKYSKFIVTRVEDFSLARITGQALKAAAKNTGALVDLWENEMSSATMAATRSLAIHMYRNGTGSRGVALTGTGGATVTLGTTSDVTNFAVGMRVQATDTDGGTLRNSGAAVTITAINRATGTLTNGVTNWSTTISGLTDGDYLLRAGDNNAVITGFGGWIPGGSAPGTLFGLSRNTDPVRLAGQSYSATGVAMSDALIEAAARVGVEGGAPTHAFCHPRDLANLKKSLDGKVQYDRASSSVAGISFSALQFEGDNGVIKVISDMNCPRNKCFLLELNTFRFDSLGPAPQILDFDSSQFLRISTADQYEVRIGTYGNLKCTKPANNIQITGFGA